MKKFLLRLMKLIVVPVLFITYSAISIIPLAIILSILLPVNVITYLFMNKWVFPKWLASWPEPLCVVADEVVKIGETD